MENNPKKRILLIDISEELKITINTAFNLSKFEILNDSGFDWTMDHVPDLLIVGSSDQTSFYKENDEIYNKDIPVLFLTGNESIPDKDIVRSFPFDLIKQPVNDSELFAKAESLLKRSDILKNFGNQSQIETKFKRQCSKVLIVDDDAHLLKLFSYNFIKSGFDVKVANDGAEGLKAAKEFEPDIIVSDIMMPKVDGYEFRKAILEDPLLKSIPFVFLTAKGAEEDILNGYDLEIEDYIVKTSGPKVIVAKVSAILKSHEKERTKLVNEINQAADSMRAKVVPDEFPEISGFNIKHWHLPYKGIPGGDFIDYIRLDDNHTAVILGDVMGKKWGAWYFAFAYAGYVRSAIRVTLQSAKEFTPGKLLQKINESVYQDAKVSEVFTTLSVLVVDGKNRIIKYAGAGDLPVIYKKVSGSGSVEQKNSNGLLLGFSFDGGYEDISIEPESGDCLFVLTDGIIESRNSAGENFGLERFASAVKNIRADEDPMDKIKDILTEFTAGEFEDDISLITIKAGA